MTREEQMWKAVEEEHGELSQRESYVTLTAMEWADENKPVDWQQVRIQAAIAAMQGFFHSDMLKAVIKEAKESSRNWEEVIAYNSINVANALVKKLTGE